MTTMLDHALVILYTVFFFGFCIFIHEFGHFLVARYRGMKVERFSIGFGSAIVLLFVSISTPYAKRQACLGALAFAWLPCNRGEGGVVTVHGCSGSRRIGAAHTIRLH